MCQDIKVVAEDGSCVICRSMQLAWVVGFSICTRPRGSVIVPPLCRGQQGHQFTTKYGYVYMDSGKLADYANDGMNEHGLSFCNLNLKMLQVAFEDVPEGHQARSLPIFLLGDFALGCFSTCQEFEEYMAKEDRVRFGAKGYSPQLAFYFQPYHAALHDRTGRSIVLQFLEGRVKVMENKVGVYTNAPDFEWQVTNLGNYVHMSPYTDYKLHTLGGLTNVKAFGHGTGMLGMPGDSRPSSRFVKAAYFREWSVPPKTAAEAVNLGEHLINNFDLAIGTNRTHDEQGKQLLNYSQVAVFKDITNLVYYFKTYQNQALRKIELDKLDLAKDRLRMAYIIEPYQAIDETARFKASPF